MKAISEEHADAIYLLSDGEPTHGVSDMRDIIFDVKQWIANRSKPLQINTIAFLMGHERDESAVRTVGK